MFCVLVPFLCAPLLVLLLVELRRARREGIIVSAKSAEQGARSPWQSIAHYGREFDVVGVVLLTIGLGMFLLPFNLYAYQPEGWRSPLIICLLVFGVVLCVLFALWERFLAPVTFIPFALLLDRNMVGACLLGAVVFISYYCWFSFFSSYLQVVNGLSVTKASYVVQIYGICSTLSAIGAGVVMRYTGRFKPITLYGALPVYTLFMGLMIHFRGATDIGSIIACQVFIALASGIIVATPTVAAMAVASHQHVAAVVAVISMFSSVGGGIGYTVAGAIWQAVFPVKLAVYLPPEQLENLITIYGSIETQLSYPLGSPTRTAIQRAYSDAQAMMLTAGTAIWVLGFIAVIVWRDIDVREVKQVKGRVV